MAGEVSSVAGDDSRDNVSQEIFALIYRLAAWLCALSTRPYWPRWSQLTTLEKARGRLRPTNLFEFIVADKSNGRADDVEGTSLEHDSKVSSGPILFCIVWPRRWPVMSLRFYEAALVHLTSFDSRRLKLIHFSSYLCFFLIFCRQLLLHRLAAMAPFTSMFQFVFFAFFFLSAM